MSPVLQILQLPFVQIALPLMLVLIVNAWGQIKRIDDLRADIAQRFGAIEKRLDAIENCLVRIEAKLDDHHLAAAGTLI